MLLHSPNNRTAGAFGHGHFVSIDGVMYRLLGNGEYHLLTSVEMKFEVQVRMVPCYSSTACFNAVAVKVGSTVVMLHARFLTDEEPVVAVNGKQVFDLAFNVGPAEYRFVFNRVSRLRFILESSFGVYLSVRMYDRYMDLHMNVKNTSYCTGSVGLWGNCNGDVFDDFTSLHGDIVTKTNISQSYLHGIYATAWKVKAQNSLFMYDFNSYHEKRTSYGGGYALFFNNTGAQTGEIYSFSSSDIAIEFMLRLQGLAGTILSYTTTETFAVTYSGTVKLHYADTVLDTLAVLEAGKWNQITLVWSKSTKILQYYQIDSERRVQSRNFPVSAEVNMFEPGGVLAIGFWRPSPTGRGNPPLESFVGEIDELRIWNKKLDSFAVSANFKRNVDCKAESLASLWKFSEGEGGVAHDCVSTAHILLPSPIWRAPLWVFSTADIPQFASAVSTVYNYKFEGKITRTFAEQKCDSLVFSSKLIYCSVVNHAVLTYYYTACVMTVTRTGSMQQSYWTVMSIADYCQSATLSNNWIARPLCNSVSNANFPNWVGGDCQIECKFGTLDGSNLQRCKCRAGFYGNSCSEECPGGYRRPCNGFSACEPTTGTCMCPLNANASADCSSCSPGWTGKDCAVATAKAINTSYVPYCQAYGAAHYTTFDGASYNFGTYGEFFALNTATVAVQVRQIPCMSKDFCISAIAIRAGGSNVTVRAPFTSNGKPSVWIDKQRTEVNQLKLSGGFMYWKTAPNTFEVTNNKTLDSGLTALRIKRWKRYLTFELVVDQSLCETASGICASCDKNMTNDFRNSSVGKPVLGLKTSQKTIIVLFSAVYSVSLTDSMFIFTATSYKEKRDITSSGYQLAFNGTYTEPFKVPFSKDTDLTIQFFVKLQAVGGTIISYAAACTFAVVNDKTIKIYIANSIYDTKVSISFNVWCQVTLVYWRERGVLIYHHLDDSGVLVTRKYFVGNRILDPGGTLMIGRWHNTPIEGAPLRSFVGSVDELRVWKKALISVAVLQSFALVIKTKVEILTSMWLFDEGEGRIIHNVMVPQTSIYLRSATLQRPLWQFSYARASSPTVVTSLETSFKNLTFQLQAQRLCSSLIYDVRLEGSCGWYMNKARLQFYFLTCLYDISSSGDLDAAYIVVTMYADYCQSLLQLTVSPAQFLCHQFPSSFSTPWIGANCNIHCVFGRESEKNSSLCVCDNGYWGKECSSVCPGGAVRPCNSHGKCNAISGSCDCEINWNGDSACGSCTIGWTGPHCLVAVTGGHVPTCSAFSAGHFSSFDGAHYSFFGTGEFRLVHNKNFKAQLRQIPCANGHSRCINALAFIFQSSWRLVFHAPYIEAERPVIWVNGTIASFVSTKYQIGREVFLEQRSSTAYAIIDTTFGIDIRIRVIGRRLTFEGILPQSLCNGTSALCGNCDGNLANDLNVTTSVSLEKMWKLTPEESLFEYSHGQYSEKSAPTGGEYGLHFKGVGVSTDLLPDIFIETFVTVELLFKTSTGAESGGVLFTYSKGTAFTLYVQGTLKIRVGAVIYDSELKPEFGDWNKITVVYNRATGILNCYHINPHGVVLVKSIKIATGLFSKYGTIAIGQWVPGSDDEAVANLKGFVGYIDEIHVWTRDFHLDEIRSNWRVNVQRYSRYLAILWKFNEGEGTMVYDLVSHVHLYIPQVADAPVWIFSYATLDVLPISNIVTFQNATLEPLAKQWCNEHITKSPLSKSCVAMGSGSSHYYYRACLRVIASYNSLFVGIEVVVAYADTCEMSLNLAWWPAKLMCNYPIFKNSRLMMWSGAMCNVPCVYGYKHLGPIGKCVCDQGFWGSSCSHVCVGGPGPNACYRHGSCASDNGVCICQSRWRGSYSCSRCTPGYTGKDCSVGISVFPVSSNKGGIVSSVSGNGHYVALDGTKIDFRGAGEFTAFVSARLGVTVQLRQVAIGGRSCLRSGAIRVGTNVIAIHSSIGMSSRVLVTYNGVHVSTKAVVAIAGTGFVYRRISHKTYGIFGPENFRLYFYHRSVYLDMIFSIARSLCQDSCGLLGSCKANTKTANVSLESNCSYEGLLDTFNKSVITQTNIDVYVKRWLVPGNESLFVDVLQIAKEAQVITAAGSCLFFNGAAVITAPLVNVYSKNDITVQFFIKPRTGGVIISYALAETFAITNNGTVKLHYGIKEFDTSLVLEPGVWSQISCVYRHDSGILQFYLIDSAGVIQTRLFFIGVGAFSSGGTIAIGLWQITTVSISIPGFVGWIDELRIWNKRLDSVTIQQGWRVNVEASLPGLAALWKFDEGEGFLVKEAVGGANIILARPPWQAPTWFSSDLNISVTGELKLLFPNETFKNDSKELCANLLIRGSFTEQCGNASGNPDFYYRSCVSDILAMGSLEAAKVSLVAMASECQAVLNLSTLPGQELCRVLPTRRYDNWVGQNCSVKCVFGQYKYGKCRCDEGYWGKNCSFECPGRAVSPCFGHGQCDTESGKCICEANWRGDSICSKCSPGWIGRYCSLAISNQSTSVNVSVAVKVCTLAEGGRVLAFDNSMYSFTAVGEFVLISGSFLQVQVRQIPCDVNTVCINGLGVKLRDLELSFHAPYEKHRAPIIYASNERIIVGASPPSALRTHNVSVTQVSANVYSLSLSHYITIKAVMFGRYMMLESVVSTEFCKVVQGLCGSCASVLPLQNVTAAENETVIQSKPITVLQGVGVSNSTKGNVDEFVREKLSVKPSDKHFIVIDEAKRKETRVVYGGGYSLNFRFTAVISYSVVNVFASNTITIQLLVRSCDPRHCGGAILSYASHVTFYITNFVTLKCVIGTSVYDTGFSTELNKWNEISVVFMRLERKMQVFLVTSAGLVRMKAFKVTVDPFADGGSLSFGLWQPSSGTKSTQSTRTFQGDIDEIRVWSVPFDYALIKQSWLSNVQVGAPSLSGLWKLNEGEGFEVKNTVSESNLALPKYPMKDPIWVFSDAPIAVVPFVNPNDFNQTLKSIARNKCFALLYSGPIYNACAGLGNVTLDFYFSACVEAVVKSGVVETTLDVVVAISDYCQTVLGMDFWPAQTLCNNFLGRRFPNWIGDNCTVSCIFGTASESDKNTCTCDKGFFGNNCSHICPGGAGNSCNKHGVCDVKSGKCRCELNWRGDLNCTSCSKGWGGADCSLSLSEHVVLSELVGVGSVSIGGPFTTFSGVSFVMRATGEYYLIRSVHVPVIVQVRLVTCFGESSCINAIALRVSSQTLVIHGPYTTQGHAVLWLNSELVNIDLHPITLKLHGFRAVRLSSAHYEITLPNLQIKIRVSGRYLSLSTYASGLVCKDSVGLLGACNRKILDSLLSYSPVLNCSESVLNNNASYGAGQITPNSSTDTQDMIIKLSKKLQILACHSLFEYKFKDVTEYRQANAGYTLFFNRTAVISAVINSPFISNDITIELMFKTVQFGVIMSYTKLQTFFLTNAGGMFTIYVGDLVFKTNITAELNAWNQINLVFKKSSTVLHFYYFRSSGLLQRVDVRIGLDLFVPGGTLAFAGWQPSLDGTGPQPIHLFVGFIDEVRIWTQTFHPAIILQTWKRSVEVSAKALARLWHFNEGQGEYVVDKIVRAKLGFGTKPWRSPVWRLSEVELKDPFYKKEPTDELENTTQQAKAEEFCHELILSGPLYSSCKDLGPGITTFYFRSCIQRIAITGSMYMSMEVITSFADYCQVSFNLTEWPARLLCNAFPGRPFPIWFGPDCNSKCLNGEKVAPNKCTCHRGYWGKECSSVCPGGSLTPCHNHGYCHSATGRCHCDANWNGSQDCRLPSRGWLGLDSSIATVQLPPLPTSYAVSTLGGHYVTFDGCSYTLVAVGTFFVINNPGKHFNFQVRHVPCYLQSVCVNALAFSVKSVTVSVHAPYQTGGYPIIWVDNTLVKLSGHNITLGPAYLGISLRHESRDHYVVTWLDNLKLFIRIEGRYLSFKVNLNSSYCYNSTGLLGSCNSNIEDDFALGQQQGVSITNATQTDINFIFGRNLSVATQESLFVLHYEDYHEQLVPTGGVYALLFNRTGASSVPLVKTFGNGVDITIELIFKPFRIGGTLLSYAVESTFAITIESTIKLFHGNRVWDTGVAIQLNVWSHLSLVWHHQKLALEFYFFSYQGKIGRRSYVLGSNPFQPGGMIQLGQWDLSPGETEAKTRESFVGLIDEMRVWKRKFDPVLIQQNWKMNVLPSYSDVSALWKCNEGEGNVVINLVSDEHILFPRKPWPQPTWVYSDADVYKNFTSTEKPFDISFNNKSLENAATSFCFEIFYKDTLDRHCGTLSAERDFYYLVCLKDIAVNGQLNAAITAVISFSDHCEVMLSLTFWPAQKLCNRFPGIHFPLWIGDECNIKCVFGTADPTDRNNCICDRGYGSKDCSKLCPGGILNTCDGHGRCDQATAKCVCDINWQGDENCSSCSLGWEGFRCQFSVSKLSAASSVTATIGGNGYFTTFFGVRFTFHLHGEFYLLKTALENFVLQIRQASCVRQGRHIPLCTTGFAFSYRDIRVTIRAPITSLSRTDIIVPIVWLNGEVVQVDHVTTLSAYFTMVRVSSVTFHISGPEGIVFILTVWSSLSINIRVSNMFCQNTTGLLGSCGDDTFAQNGTDIEPLLELLASSSVVHQKNSLFVYQYLSYREHRHVTGGGFTLYFRDSLVRSRPQYFSRVNILTIELLLKTHKYGGTILSYAHQSVFAVVNDQTLKVVYRNRVIDTGISNEIGKWNQISLVFKKFIGVLQLYHFDSKGLLSIRVSKLDKDILMDGGILVFGQWQPSRDQSSKPPSSTFVGEIDEVRCWERRTNPDLIRRNWRLNVQVGNYRGLLHLWKLNQADGFLIRDLVSDNHLYSVKFHEPLWTFSDADIPKLGTDNIRIGDLSIQLKAESYCLSLILTGPLFNNCKKLGVQVAQFYYKVCLSDIAVSKELSWAVYSVVSYADYCQAALELTLWPAKQLCHHFIGVRFPYWIGSRCEIPCVFGYAVRAPNASKKVVCACEKGYWGDDCSNLCPGGLWNVCSGHGSCDPVNGTCLCEPHWRGTSNNTESSNCSQCTVGWTGFDCAIAVEKFIKKTNNTGLSINFGDPHFTTVAGVNYHFEVPGSYRLLGLPGLDAQVLQLPCDNRLSCRRITEVAVNTTTVFFSVMYKESGVVSSMLIDHIRGQSTSLLESNSWQNVGDLAYRWIHPQILEVKEEKMKIKFTILLYYGTLGTAIEVPFEMRDNTVGVCGREVSDWVAHLQSQSRSNTNTTALSQAVLDERISVRESISKTDVILKNRFSGFSFTGAGYMLTFGSHKQVLFIGDSSYQMLDEFTFEIWICLLNQVSDVSHPCSVSTRDDTVQPDNTNRAPLSSKHAIISSSTKSGSFALLYDRGIRINCFGNELSTGLNISEGIWHHVAVTWRNNDGRVQVFVKSHGNSTVSTSTYGHGIGLLFSLDGFLLFGR